jgi:hypothetical protein
MVNTVGMVFMAERFTAISCGDIYIVSMEGFYTKESSANIVPQDETLHTT